MALSVDARGTHSDRPATAPASTGSGRSGGAPPPRGARRRDDTRLAAVFLIPASIGLVVFYFWPLLRGIWLSFTSWDLLSPARFIGIENYQRMLADPIFWNAARAPSTTSSSTSASRRSSPSASRSSCSG